MVSKKIILAVDIEILRKAKTKAEKQGYKSIQQYIYELIRRDLFRKKAGGRPRQLSSDEEYLNKFSTPTKETRKIERMIKERRI